MLHIYSDAEGAKSSLEGPATLTPRFMGVEGTFSSAEIGFAPDNTRHHLYKLAADFPNPDLILSPYNQATPCAALKAEESQDRHKSLSRNHSDNSR